jgi:hypothetical protein
MLDDQNPYRSPQAGPQDGRPDLGANTSDQSDLAPPEPPDDLVQLTSYQHAVEANLCQSVLRDHGIESSLENEAATINLFLSNAVGGVKVFVMSSDLPRATELLVEARDAMRAKMSQGPITFHCEECNAEVTFPGDRRGHVETCPKCQEYVDVPD